MAKVLCVLYDDPVDGHPKSYARDGISKLDRYPDGQTLPKPKAIDFHPGPNVPRRADLEQANALAFRGGVDTLHPRSGGMSARSFVAVCTDRIQMQPAVP